MQLAVGNMGNGTRNGNASARQKHATTNAIAHTDNSAVPNTTWTLLGAHFDPGPDEFRIFVNGTEDTNLWTAGSGAFDNESDQAFAFGNGVGGSRAYHGHIAYWGCWDVSGLTNGQIDALVSAFYNSGTGTTDVPNQTELVEFVRFSASGETSGDLSVLTSPTVTGATFDSGQSAPVTYNALGGATTHERSASLTGTGTITTAGQRALQRSAAVAGTGTIAVAGQRALQRAVAVSGTGTISASGHGVLARSATVSGTGSITVAPQRVLLRQAAVAGTGTITVTGQVEGPGATTHERSVAITGTGAIATSGQRHLQRATSLTGVGTITTGRQLVALRSVALTGTGTISVSGVRVGLVEEVGRIEGGLAVSSLEAGSSVNSIESSGGVLALNE